MTEVIPAEYLVQHGQGGFLGRFRNHAHRRFERGERVVVQTQRGLELGTLTGVATSRFANLVDPALAGELVRGATSEDVSRGEECVATARQIVEEAQTLVERAGWPLTILDGEILLDGQHAILQGLRWGECDATSLFEELSQRHSLLVLLEDLTATPQPEKAGCGKEGCGSSGGCSSCGTGGGCSTGSCSSGKVKSAGELTAYFADLRQKMEADTRRVALVQ